MFWVSVFCVCEHLRLGGTYRMDETNRELRTHFTETLLHILKILLSWPFRVPGGKALPQEALEAARSALPILRELGEQRGQAAALLIVSRVQLGLGESSAALRAATEA